MTDAAQLFNASSSIVGYSAGHWSSASENTFETKDLNATATFTFTGTSITVFGTLRFAQNISRPLTYVLDDQSDDTFVYNASSAAIYASPSLSDGAHSLSIRLASPNTTFSISGGDIGELNAAEGHQRMIAIVAGVLGGAVLLVVICAALLLWYRRRQRNSTPYALGPLQANLPLSKEAFTSPKYSNYGLSFSQSTDSLNVLPVMPRVSVRVPSSESLSLNDRDAYTSPPRRKLPGERDRSRLGREVAESTRPGHGPTAKEAGSEKGSKQKSSNERKDDG
uniref:Uncharacterized protein n=1 Tax=Mycena chlorophos TaxID=658473 RepID=A0ABQ0LR58_MYCCL|nr:predicted protein [Mycena chlorophos]